MATNMFHRKKLQYQDAVSFQCALPTLTFSPVFVKPSFDIADLASYKSNSLESTTQPSLLADDDSAVFNISLVNQEKWEKPANLPTWPDGTTELPADDIELLPEDQLDANLKKLAGKRADLPSWLRYQEPTELPQPNVDQEQFERKRASMIRHQPAPKITQDFVDIGQGGVESFEQAIEGGFRIAEAIDKEWKGFSSCKTQAEQKSFKRTRLVHPNPKLRNVVPTSVTSVLPAMHLWRNKYELVRFLDGNPIPHERLVKPGEGDFQSLSTDEQKKRKNQTTEHRDSLLFAKQTDDESLEFTYLLPQRKQAEDDSEEPTAKRQKIQTFDVGGEWTNERTTEAEQDFVFLVTDTGVQYLPLTAAMNLRKKDTLGRALSTQQVQEEDKKRATFVVETREFSRGEQRARIRRWNPMQEDGDREIEPSPSPEPEPEPEPQPEPAELPQADEPVAEGDELLEGDDEILEEDDGEGPSEYLQEPQAEEGDAAAEAAPAEGADLDQPQVKEEDEELVEEEDDLGEVQGEE
eukprot:TRINITY_DN5945_c0_g1_i1.p2 TRINITY_DN5945_c0_g1~~TRINITY_DN5945_c0_g1_i1.p2  ORF type:complete len:522 (-),score=93.53 TRINITY_DN5945_c0_g1_i1:1999-3564(-)